MEKGISLTLCALCNSKYHQQKLIPKQESAVQRASNDLGDMSGLTSTERCML